MVKDDEESTVIFPSKSWLVKFKVAFPPFDPVVPQSPSDTFNNKPEGIFKLQFSIFILAAVLVTKNIGAVEE